jgi:hypothetical protein
VNILRLSRDLRHRNMRMGSREMLGSAPLHRRLLRALGVQLERGDGKRVSIWIY